MILFLLRILLGRNTSLCGASYMLCIVPDVDYEFMFEVFGIICLIVFKVSIDDLLVHSSV